MGRDGAGSQRLGESVKPTVPTDTPPYTGKRDSDQPLFHPLLLDYSNEINFLKDWNNNVLSAIFNISGIDFIAA